MRHTVSDPGLLVLSTVFYCGGAETGAHMPAADGRAAGYIAAWRPSSASPEAAAFARRVVTAAAPAGRPGPGQEPAVGRGDAGWLGDRAGGGACPAGAAAP